MEQKPIIIGHVDHGKTTLIAGITSLLSSMNRDDVIVIDESNIQSVREQLQANKLEMHRGIELTKETVLLSQLAVTTYKERAQGLPGKTAHRKNHKPNTGMKLGSYKFKSNKNK